MASKHMVHTVNKKQVHMPVFKLRRGATRCTNVGEIWCGGFDQRSTPCQISPTLVQGWGDHQWVNHLHLGIRSRGSGVMEINQSRQNVVSKHRPLTHVKFGPDWRRGHRNPQISQLDQICIFSFFAP